MEDTNLLADRCIFIDILRVTRNRTVLLKFVYPTFLSVYQRRPVEMNRMSTNENNYVSMSVSESENPPVPGRPGRKIFCVSDVFTRDVVRGWVFQTNEVGQGGGGVSKKSFFDR